MIAELRISTEMVSRMSRWRLETKATRSRARAQPSNAKGDDVLKAAIW